MIWNTTLRIRLAEFKDLEKLREIHNRYYEREFKFPFDRCGWFSPGFIIEDCNGNPITFGMFELTAEAILITDKDYSVNERVQALKMLFEVMKQDAREHNVGQFHAVVINEPSWEVWLKRYGFKSSRGNFLHYVIGK